jgi:hypothetical protein
VKNAILAQIIKDVTNSKIYTKILVSLNLILLRCNSKKQHRLILITLKSTQKPKVLVYYQTIDYNYAL